MSGKIKVLEAKYSTSYYYDLEENGIDYDEIEKYHIRYGTMWITLKDGTTETIEGRPGEIDIKWPRIQFYETENQDYGLHDSDKDQSEKLLNRYDWPYNDFI
tara:strand:+ start:164 stop:469 length:306 start_codon:yes stop_codon:yes gene_type:complete